MRERNLEGDDSQSERQVDRDREQGRSATESLDASITQAQHGECDYADPQRQADRALLSDDF